MVTSILRHLPLIKVITIAVILRLLIYYLLPQLSILLTSFIPLNTPISSWKRYQEGLFLYHRGMNLYDNNVFHQSPLFLPIFTLIPKSCHFLVFILLDITVTITLYILTSCQPILEPLSHSPAYIDRDPSHKKLKSSVVHLSSSVNIDRYGAGIEWTPIWVSSVYLFNPLTILSCLIMDIGLIERSTLMLGAVAASFGDSIWSSLCLVIAIQHGFHTIAFIPIFAMIQRRVTQLSSAALIPAMVISVIAWIGICCMLYYHIMELNPLTVLYSTVGFMLTVPDMTPNIGIWWYFLQEVFDHFRDFFVFVFQFHIFIYLIPVLIRFGKEVPIFCLSIYWGVITILRPYPTIGDFSLWFALLPIYANTWKYYRYSYLLITLFICTILLFPTMYLLYVRLHSGNANFPYALTLLIFSAAVMLQSDMIYGVLIRLHHSCTLTYVHKEINRVMEEEEEESTTNNDDNEVSSSIKQVHLLDHGNTHPELRKRNKYQNDSMLLSETNQTELDKNIITTLSPSHSHPEPNHSSSIQQDDLIDIDPYGEYPSVLMYSA